MQSTNNVDLQKVRRLGNPVGSTQKCFIDDVAMQCSQSKQRNVMICYHLPYSLELRHPSQSERSPYAQSLGPKFGLEFPIGPTKRSAITVHTPRYIGMYPGRCAVDRNLPDPDIPPAYVVAQHIFLGIPRLGTSSSSSTEFAHKYFQELSRNYIPGQTKLLGAKQKNHPATQSIWKMGWMLIAPSSNGIYVIGHP